jgi:hypothetical protein
MTGQQMATVEDASRDQAASEGRIAQFFARMDRARRRNGCP